MQLQAVLCCTYNMIFITIFKIKHKLYMSQGQRLPPPKGKIVGACLVHTVFIWTHLCRHRIIMPPPDNTFRYGLHPGNFIFNFYKANIYWMLVPEGY
jgi:hypothetical protein